jgi:conjugal transfer pilus assembly protein TrbC
VDSAGPDLLVFVSFAMPRASLERLAADAARTGAVMVFRGPKEGSLRKTLQAFEPLARRGASAILHPEAFTRHRIETVPVYVLGNTGGCQADSNETACQGVLRISGDASLDFILERMARADHPLAAVAEARLARLRKEP